MADIAAEFCKHVASSDMDNATVRIGAWLIGVAEKVGGFPLNITPTDIRNGLEIDGVRIAGTGSRRETVMQSIAKLEEAGFLLPITKHTTNGSSLYRGFDWAGR